MRAVPAEASLVPLGEEFGDALLRDGPAWDAADEHGDLDGLQDLLLGGAVVLRDPGLGVDAVLAHPDRHARERHEPLGLPVERPVLDHDPVHGVEGVDERGVQLVDRLQRVGGVSAHSRAHLSELAVAACGFFLRHGRCIAEVGHNRCPPAGGILVP